MELEDIKRLLKEELLLLDYSTGEHLALVHFILRITEIDPEFTKDLVVSLLDEFEVSAVDPEGLMEVLLFDIFPKVQENNNEIAVDLMREIILKVNSFPHKIFSAIFWLPSRDIAALADIFERKVSENPSWKDGFLWALHHFLAERPHIGAVFLKSRAEESQYEDIKEIYKGFIEESEAEK